MTSTLLKREKRRSYFSMMNKCNIFDNDLTFSIETEIFLSLLSTIANLQLNSGPQWRKVELSELWTIITFVIVTRKVMKSLHYLVEKWWLRFGRIGPAGQMCQISPGVLMIKMIRGHASLKGINFSSPM